MGARILDGPVLPTQIENGDPLSSRLHKLPRLQGLEFLSGYNLHKQSHGDLLLKATATPPWCGSASSEENALIFFLKPAVSFELAIT
jgi:hypothetical protein